MRSKLITTAKEKGFELKPHSITVDKNYFLWMCLLQQWFRDTHKIDIIIDFNINPTGYKIFIIKRRGLKLGAMRYDIDERFNTYEEALEKGLEMGLSII